MDESEDKEVDTRRRSVKNGRNYWGSKNKKKKIGKMRGWKALRNEGLNEGIDRDKGGWKWRMRLTDEGK